MPKLTPDMAAMMEEEAARLTPVEPVAPPDLVEEVECPECGTVFLPGDEAAGLEDIIEEELDD